MPRIVWLATGVAWALSSLALIAGVPAGGGNVLAAVTYSAAWLLFAPSIALVSRLAEARRTHFLGTAIAVVAGVTGLANIVVNVVGVAGLSEWYLYGILIATVLLVPFAYLFARERFMRLVAFVLGLFLAIGFIPPVIGGAIVLLLFGALAFRTAWFQSRARVDTLEPAS